MTLCIKKCNTSTHPSRVYTYKQDLKEYFPKTSLEGLTTWSKKMVKIVAAANDSGVKFLEQII